MSRKNTLGLTVFALTKEQTEIMRPLFEKAMSEAENGEMGMIIAQIVKYNGKGLAQVQADFINNEYAEAVIKSVRALYRYKTQHAAERKKPRRLSPRWTPFLQSPCCFGSHAQQNIQAGKPLKRQEEQDNR